MILVETLEGLILNSLLEGSELEASLGDDRAVELNGVNDLAESVELRYVLRRNHYSLVLIDNDRGTCRGVQHHSVMLTSEEHVQLSQFMREFLERGRESCEDEV